MTGDRAVITAIVLAGGRSSRFGSQKLAIKLDGASLLEHTCRAVAGIAGVILVAGSVTTQPPAIPGRQVRLVVDKTPFAGPLAALANALHAVTTANAIVVGGDMLAVVPDVLRAMLERLDTNPALAAVLLEAASGPPAASNPAVGARAAPRQTLPLALRVARAAAAADETILEGDRSLASLLDRLATAELDSRDWGALDPTGLSLFDVDEPADLERWRSGEFR